MIEIILSLIIAIAAFGGLIISIKNHFLKKKEQEIIQTLINLIEQEIGDLRNDIQKLKKRISKIKSQSTKDIKLEKEKLEEKRLDRERKDRDAKIRATKDLAKVLGILK